MNSKVLIKKLITQYGELYSEQLGIKIEKKTERELFKWFLAAILFGKRIGENIAIKTYHEFEKAGILTPERILEASWDKLVQLLDRGGYVRYDFSTATRLQEICKALLDRYGKEALIKIHDIARDNGELESNLLSFKGIGPVTSNIFLRELRTVWEKADPEPLPIVKNIAKKYNIDLSRYIRKTEKFMRLEVALLRIRKISNE